MDGDTIIATLRGAFSAIDTDILTYCSDLLGDADIPLEERIDAASSILVSAGGGNLSMVTQCLAALPLPLALSLERPAPPSGCLGAPPNPKIKWHSLPEVVLGSCLACLDEVALVRCARVCRAFAQCAQEIEAARGGCLEILAQGEERVPRENPPPRYEPHPP